MGKVRKDMKMMILIVDIFSFISSLLGNYLLKNSYKLNLSLIFMGEGYLY